MNTHLEPNEITQLSLNGYYAWIHYRNKSEVLHSYTLKVFAEKLARKASFRHIHRKYLVHEAFIKAESKDNVLLQNGELLPLARRRK